MDQLNEYLQNTNLVDLAVTIGIRLVLVLLIYIVGRWLARMSQQRQSGVNQRPLRTPVDGLSLATRVPT